MHCEHPLFDWLILLNSPSFLIIEVIAIPKHVVFGKNILIGILFGFVLFFFVCLQWFLIGFIIKRSMEMLKSKEIKLSLD